MVVLPNGIIGDKVIENYDNYNYYCSDKINASSFDIYYVGRLTKQKNVELLIKEFLNSDYKDSYKAKLHIIGIGDFHSYFIRKYGNEESIKFYGFLNDPWQIVPSSSIVIVPSLWDEPGHVPLEALSFGHRVFISSGCSLIDFISDDLLKLSSFRPNEISKLMTSLHLKSDIEKWKKLKMDIRSLLYKFSNKNFSKVINQYSDF